MNFKTHGREKKSQTTMVAMILVVMAFVFVTIFLLSMLIGQQATKITEARYMKRFASNLLVSLTRMKTSCGEMSDVIKGAYFGRPACQAGCDCEAFFKRKAPMYISQMLNESGYTGVDYLIVLETDASARKIQVGDAGAKAPGAWDAVARTAWHENTLQIRIYIKDSK